MKFNEYTFSGIAQLDFSEFSRRMAVVDGPDADKLRHQFITSFLDTKSDWYKDKIQSKNLFSDGWYYTGYLWECIKKFELRRTIDILDELGRTERLVYALWDIHSNDSIRIDNYWQFPKESVLAGIGKDLALGLRYLPQDLYVFNGGFDFSLVLTHEHDDHGRTCCKAYAS